MAVCVGSDCCLEDSAGAAADEDGFDMNEINFRRMREELKALKAALRTKDEEDSRLTQIRENLEAELEELTASLRLVAKIPTTK